jgi:TRAP-type C4-dicarboxylate transport system permease small subunit
MIAMKMPGVESVSKVGVWIAGFAVGAMMIHITIDVLLKYTLNQAVPGTLEIVSAYYMVAAVFFPIAALEISRSSISVDVIYQFLPRAMQVISMALVYLASVIVYWSLAWNSWRDALRSFEVGEVMMGGVMSVSIWPSRFVMPVSLLVAGVVCLWHLALLLTSASARAQLIAVLGPQDAEQEGA